VMRQQRLSNCCYRIVCMTSPAPHNGLHLSLSCSALQERTHPLCCGGLRIIHVDHKWWHWNHDSRHGESLRMRALPQLPGTRASLQPIDKMCSSSLSGGDKQLHSFGVEVKDFSWTYKVHACPILFSLDQKWQKTTLKVLLWRFL